METVTVSPEFQIVIPRAVRERMGLKPGHKLQVTPCGEGVTLVPLRRLSETRGFLRGIDTTVAREPDRREP